MTPILVTQIDLQDGCRHVRYLRFSLPFVCDRGGYIAIVSFNAFFHGRKERNRSSRYLYHARYQDDVMFDPPHDGVPVVDLADIWDFYKLVGYDYRKKKYING